MLNIRVGYKKYFWGPTRNYVNKLISRIKHMTIKIIIKAVAEIILIRFEFTF